MHPIVICRALNPTTLSYRAQIGTKGQPEPRHFPVLEKTSEPRTRQTAEIQEFIARSFLKSPDEDNLSTVEWNYKKTWTNSEYSTVEFNRN